MQKEIGSEFEFDFESIMSIDGKELTELFSFSNYHLVNSGRSGVKQILLNLINTDNKRNGEFLLPSYLCPSIVQAYKELNVNIIYYNIKQDLTIDLEDLLSKITNRTNSIYFINYFGALQPKNVILTIMELKNKGITVIEDITHNYFSKRHDIGDYLVASLRKWGPLPLGGIVIVNKNRENYKTYYEESVNTFQIVQLKSFAQQLKSLYLNKIREDELKSTYLKLFNITNDALYSSAEVVPMDELSLNVFRRLDFVKLIEQRRRNYLYLFNHLQHINDIHIILGNIEDKITPLGFHITLENREKLRKYLIKNKVYASVHWMLPEEVKFQFKEPYNLSNQILTVPCDHRYSEEDMAFTVNLFKNYFNSNSYGIG